MEGGGGGGREQQMQIVCVRSASAGEEGAGEWESSRSALSLFQEKEEEIERKKLEVREKIFSMLGRVEEETKRLAFIRQELEVMADPMRREVETIRKRIDKVNRQLKPLGKSCLEKEKEYKARLEAYNQKSNEKATLVNRLMELVGESERLRMRKLEELNKTIETLY
ncbi:hypothetical protein ABZP36_033011 [Zizania latifolia]